MSMLSFGIQYLRGKSLSGLIQSAWKSVVEFFTKVPPYDVETEKSTSLKVAHWARHIIKCILSVPLVALSLAAAVIATTTASIMSQKGSTNFFIKLLHLGVNVSDKLAFYLTWGPTLFVQGTQNIKSLFAVGIVFTQIISKFAVGLVAGTLSFFHLLFTGRLFSAIAAGIRAVKENPYREIVPGIRYSILILLGVAVGINGYANGHARAETSAWISYTVTLIAATLSSVGVNLMAILNSVASDTPVRNLDKPVNDNNPDLGTYGKDASVLLGPSSDGDVQPGFDGFAGRDDCSLDSELVPLLAAGDDQPAATHTPSFVPPPPIDSLVHAITPVH